VIDKYDIDLDFKILVFRKLLLSVLMNTKFYIRSLLLFLVH